MISAALLDLPNVIGLTGLSPDSRASHFTGVVTLKKMYLVIYGCLLSNVRLFGPNGITRRPRSCLATTKIGFKTWCTYWGPKNSLHRLCRFAFPRIALLCLTLPVTGLNLTVLL